MKLTQEKALWIAAAAMVVAMILAQLLPEVAAAMEFDRAAVASGQWWRVATCNLAHFNWTHTAVAVSVLTVLCWVGAGRS